MEETSYNVIFRGEITEGQDIEKVRQNLAELFKVNSEKILTMSLTPLISIHLELLPMNLF